MKRFINSIIFAFIALNLLAQPNIQWQTSLGGSDSEQAYAIQQTTDNGYIVAGYTYSNDGDVSNFHGVADFWVIKLNSAGIKEWAKTVGGSDIEWATSVRQAHDGGYIVAGFTESTDGDVSGNHGDKDAWIVKLNTNGNIEWQKAIGGSGWDEAESIELTSDGGYIMVGKSNSTDGDAAGNIGGSLDLWIVKLNSSGVIEWQKAIGGSEEESAQSIKETSDGGYIVAGETLSSDGDVMGNNGNIDFWIVKLNDVGVIEWQNALGGTGLDATSEIHETADGYIVSGYAGSTDGDITGYQGLFDYWVVKLNPSGDLLWQKTLGGSNADWAYSGTPSNDGGYVVAGTTRSTNGDVLNNDGGQDIWLVKLDSLGEMVWQKILGGSLAENGLSISRTSDSGFVLAGRSSSSDGDATENHGGSDFWVVKLSPETVNLHEPAIPFHPLAIHPNPARETISITAAASSLDVTLYDLLQRKIFQKTIPNNSNLDVSSLPSGLYLVAATSDLGQVYTGKLRKQ